MGIANSAAISEGKFSVSFNVISFSRCFVSGSNVAWMKLVFSPVWSQLKSKTVNV